MYVFMTRVTYHLGITLGDDFRHSLFFRIYPRPVRIDILLCHFSGILGDAFHLLIRPYCFHPCLIFFRQDTGTATVIQFPLHQIQISVPHIDVRTETLLILREYRHVVFRSHASCFLDEELLADRLPLTVQKEFVGSVVQFPRQDA